MLKRLLAVVVGFAVGIGVFAAEAELRDDHPDTYVVQKGDTLWDISARFLKAPWLWPEIWQANPQVENPHLIYPGDRLSLVYLDGRPILRGDGRFGPRIRAQPLDDAVTTVPLSEVQAFLKKTRVLDKSDIETAPYVVALEENRLRGATGQIAYVRGIDVQPGTRVYFARPTLVYYSLPSELPCDESPRRDDVDPWTTMAGEPRATLWDNIVVDIACRDERDYLGHEVIESGVGEVLRGGDPATVLVQYSDFEVKKGDLALLSPLGPYDLTFYPRAPGKVPDGMRVLAFTDALGTVGPKQVVALNKGARDGVENGQTYSIFEPGEVIQDRVKYRSDDYRTVFKRRRDDVQLPEEFIGHVMVFRTFDKVSYGLIMDGIRPVHLGDRLREPLR